MLAPRDQGCGPEGEEVPGQCSMNELNNIHHVYMQGTEGCSNVTDARPPELKSCLRNGRQVQELRAVVGGPALVKGNGT